MKMPFYTFACLWLCLELLVSVGHAQPSTRIVRIGPQEASSHALQSKRQEFDLLPIDTLFFIDNQGLTRVHVQVNTFTFRLTTDPDEVPRGANTFLIPLDGEVTVNIAPAILSDGGNTIALESTGPEGSSADVVIGDFQLTNRIHYVLELEPGPETLALLQNYPNPFTGQTTITYTIPKQRTSGLPMRLIIYDALGRRIQTLVDDRRFPGEFTVVWDGRNDQGRQLASGMYFCRLVAGRFQDTIPMVLL